jgi:hypothetical protein
MCEIVGHGASGRIRIPIWRILKQAFTVIGAAAHIYTFFMLRA